MTHTTRKRWTVRLRRLFGAKPCRVQVAALPWRKVDNAVQVMLITSRDTGRWVLPKGWPEGVEKLHDAAAREAVEEAGLTGAVSAVEIGRYFYRKARRSGDDVQCEVHVFPLEVDRVADDWDEKRKRTRKWVSATDAARLVNEPDLGEVIAHFCANPRQVLARSQAA
ncbi:MAG: NUDIX hydrolase [Mesorhizobium sp.]|nr:NUDIX hydrolase [Mesorhizobium sp.]